MSVNKIAFITCLFVLSAAGLNAQVKHHHSSLTASVVRGQQVYIQNCLTCHQANGTGVPTMNPPLIQTTYVLGDKAKLITIVLNGFNEDVQINGQTYSNNMTPHATLTDQQIADVLTYVRNSFTNKASAVTIAQVKMVRAANKK
jgi:mono/diheme cytochrome c family protein